MKWLSKRQYIYRIRNYHTDARYVGSTDVSPFGRWAELLSELRNGRGNKRFQAAWNDHPTLTAWEFTVLAEIEPKINLRELRACEAEFICSVPDRLRLNMPHRTTVSRDKYNRVVMLLERGRRYRDICDEVGISIGMVSKIKRSTQAS